MLKKTDFILPLMFVMSLGIFACSPGGSEARAVVLPVSVDGTQLFEGLNDLGWNVAVDALRMAVRNPEFTIEGEVHASLLKRISNWVVPCAYAHPGHYAGGEVTGELPGDYIVDFTSGDLVLLGNATLLEGDYHGFNLYFRTATSADTLDAGDPLLNHSIFVSGTATKSDRTISFTIVADQDAGVSIVGGVFEMNLKEGYNGSLVIGFENTYLHPENGLESIFDGIDFAALDEDGDDSVSIIPGDVAHNLFKKEVIIHDYWKVVPTVEEKNK